MWNILLLILSMASIYAGQLSPAEVDHAVTDLINVVNKTRVSMTGNPKGDITDMPLLAGFLRFSYHDCIGKGACDGCLNIEAPGNKGLEKVLDVLNGLYDDNEGYGMSRADYYALAGWTAVQIAPKRKGQNGAFLEITREEGIDFLFGRKDCDNVPYETEDDVNADRFPSSCFTLEQSADYFKTSFDFTQEETVAIMGAHTLGMIRNGLPKNKAKEWVPGSGCSSRFNNKLYEKMMSSKLKPQRQRDNQVCSWCGSGTFLDSDVSVAYHIPRNNDGKISCANCDNIDGIEYTLERCCDKAAGYDQVKEYQEDNEKFISDFAKAYQKMLNHGHNDLVAVDYSEPARLQSKPQKVRQRERKGKKGGKQDINIMSYVEDAINNIQDQLDEIKNDLA